MEDIWIESIQVQSNAGMLEEATPALKNEVGRLKARPHVREVYFLRHEVYSGDLLIAIVWDDQTPQQKTLEGFMLVDSLKSLGSVNHTLWTPFKRVSD